MSSHLISLNHDDSVDEVRAYGPYALGGRLRRLSERIDREAKILYKEAGVAFEQRWFPVFNCLRRGDALSVTELADRLGVSHVSVSNTRTSLEEEGLITSIADSQDARRRVLVLTERGENLAQQLSSLFEAMGLAAVELNTEADNAIEAISRLEDALTRKSLSLRTREILAKKESEVK